MEKETQTEKVEPIIPSPPPLPEHRDVFRKTTNSKKKKKRSLLKMIKVAIFMLRQTSTTSKETSLWKRIVNAVKSFHNDQLHFDENRDYHPRFSIKMAGADVVVKPVVTSDSSSSNSPKSPSCTSQYASAQNLQELDNSERGGAEYSSNDEIYIDEDGDIMIDARAEEFIALFYEQMRLQRSKSLDDHSIRFSLHEF
ncbi:uncharacterized protein LOC113334553 [Papaver somniferum]|uniref:uncharacterized protein LOC113334553 n=1 Tax=Papaver somniferum TaxID=3469 RepID=UPI000E6F755C|nr:uncharacterized protein LOC113334553 [Papaver somniferum]